MKDLYRVFFGIFIGILSAFIMVFAVEVFSAFVYPLPEGFMGTKEEMCQHVEKYPDWVLGIVVVLWGLTAFVGTWLAQRIGSIWASSVVAILILWALGFNLNMLPYASWFKGTMPVVALIAVALGILRGKAGRAKPPLKSDHAISG